MANKTLVLAGVGIATLIGAVSAVSLVSADSSSIATSTQAKKTWSFKGLQKGIEKSSKEGKGGHEGMKGGFGGGFGFEMGGKDNKNPAITAAIKANDYNAFVTAWNTDTKKPSGATVPTQDKFNEMVADVTKRASIEAAIAANDYNAFVEASKPTQTEFTKIVAEYKAHKAIEAAITAKDYNAFVTAWNADTKKPAKATVPTQEQFNAMVAKPTQK